MKTVIIFASTHHGNTKKLLDAIAEKYGVKMIDATKEEKEDLSCYDRIGFASGVYFSSFHKSVLAYAKECLPKGKEVFLIETYGSGSGTKAISKVIEEKSCRLLGTYGCKGFDTFGPFKLVGGISKGHPTKEEVEGAVTFFENLGK